MFTRFLKKYISIIFIVAAFMGVFHHHHDLKQHNDCKICTINSNLTNIDTPSEILYLRPIEKIREENICKLFNLHINKHTSTLQARAPPKFS
jgi:hypothetical protein